MTGLFSEVAVEELAIWATVGVALLLVAAMIWRGERMPTIETNHKDHRDDPHIHNVLAEVDKEREQDVDEQTWLANNRYLRKETRAEAQEFRPGSPTDLKSLPQLAISEPAKTEAKPATNAVLTTAPAKDDTKQDATKKDKSAAKLPVPAVQHAAEPTDPATSPKEGAIENSDSAAVKRARDETF